MVFCHGGVVVFPVPFLSAVGADSPIGKVRGMSESQFVRK